MAVRFLPSPSERSAAPSEDRADLAEVIEFRSKLRRRGWADPVDEFDDGRVETSAGHSDKPVRETAAQVPILRASELGGPARAARDSAGSPGRAAGVGAVPLAAPVPLQVSPPAPTAEADGADGDSAYQEAVRLLARRARSSGELRDDLLRLEHDPHEVEHVIAEFECDRYLDDQGLARAVTEKLRETKRASRAQIRVKLRERKLPDAVIEEALGELDADEEFELLREAAADRARKLGGLDRQTAERRLLGFLARRGWSGEPAMRAARAALDGEARGRSSGGVRFR
ncbi:MAG: regulatory protein RecX [Leucobacter sp.]